MNSAPLPQPSAQTCPNCGAPAEGNARFCPRCGADLKTASGGGSGGGCIIVLAQIVLSMVALVLGLLGACFVLLGGNSFSNSPSGNGESFTMLFGGLIGVAIAGLCIWGIVKLSKR